eukprot:5518578-Pleurochrysis_carterae.AAC.1
MSAAETSAAAAVYGPSGTQHGGAGHGRRPAAAGSDCQSAEKQLRVHRSRRPGSTCHSQAAEGLHPLSPFSAAASRRA